MNPFVVPGFSVHQELRLLVEAGLTPYEALETGTSNAAAALGLSQDFGIVRHGARADLLVLEANPLEDVGHASRRAGVVLRGEWHAEQDLRRRLATLAEKHRAGQRSR